MAVSEPPVLRFAPLQDVHIETMLLIEQEAYPEPWTRGMFHDEMRSNRSYFRVVFEGDCIVGYCGFWLVLDEAHITTVVVRDSERGRGVGRQLVVHLLNAAREAGAVMATLEVRESNEPARALYRSFGFNDVGRRTKYYPKSGEDAIVMLLEFDGEDNYGG